MGEHLTAIAVALIAGITALATTLIGRRDRGGGDPPTVTEAVDRSADALVRALVDAQQDLDGLSGHVWSCPVASCPVRDHLRREQQR